MTEILKASEIPAGARILNGQGRALTGTEIALGLQALVEREVGPTARVAIEDALEREWWPSNHLTFPRAKLEWCLCPGGIWLTALLAYNQKWEFRFNDEEADIRDLKQIGPFRSPDDLRDELGLPRIAQFRLPDGAIVTAELPQAALRAKAATKEEVLAQFPEVPQAVARPTVLETDSLPVWVDPPEAELLAEPPNVETVAPPAEPAKQKPARKVVVRGKK